jgi:hypothetical protein
LFAPSLVWFIVSLSRSQISLSFQPLIPNNKKKTSSSEKPKFFQVLILQTSYRSYILRETYKKCITRSDRRPHRNRVRSSIYWRFFVVSLRWKKEPAAESTASSLSHCKCVEVFSGSSEWRLSQQAKIEGKKQSNKQKRQQKQTTDLQNIEERQPRDMGLWRRQQKCSEKQWEEPNAALAGPNERAELALRSQLAARLHHYSVVIVVVGKPAQKREKLTNKQTLAARTQTPKMAIVPTKI